MTVMQTIKPVATITAINDAYPTMVLVKAPAKLALTTITDMVAAGAASRGIASR